MTIQEAIKFIVDKQDKSILTDSKKFCAYLKDLSPECKELKIFNRILDDNLLEKIFSNERDNVKIAKIKDELQDQGLSDDWILSIITCFGKALSWNIQNINNQIQPKISKPVSYVEVTLGKGENYEIGVLEQLGYTVEEVDERRNNLYSFRNSNSEKVFKIFEYDEKLDTPLPRGIASLNSQLLAIQGRAIQENKRKEIISIDIPSTYQFNNKNYMIVGIDNSGFSKFTSLENITIPDSVTEIGAFAFYGCSSLKNINIPNGIKEIKQNTFADCRSLENIIIPDSVTEIGLEAFVNSGLKNITIPSNINIGNSAFKNCYSLQTINIYDNVNNTNITIPAGLFRAFQ